jgi:hypothetical protein
MRRVVTARGSDGQSTVASDAPAPATRLASSPGYEKVDIWGSDGLLSLETDGTEPRYERFFPPPAGFRIIVITFPPTTGEADPDGREAMAAEMEERFPGALSDRITHDNATGFHKTATVDVGYVLEGELSLELDDGSVTRLIAGDSFVQNGTSHVWRDANGCKLLLVLLGAAPSEEA